MHFMTSEIKCNLDEISSKSLEVINECLKEFLFVRSIKLFSFSVNTLAVQKCEDDYSKLLQKGG